MFRRDLSQPSFVDAMVSGCGKVGGFLDRIDKAFDWSAFEALLSPIHGSVRGAPGYPPLTMVKILLVQQWHTLSDPGAEEAVRDRLSFRRFCGLPLEADTPDHASIWGFRQTIDKLGLSTALLSETNRQLDALGLIVKRGTLVDATLIEAAVKRPPYGDNGLNPRDPDARVTMKRKTVHFGDKAHLAVDEESGLVRQAEMTSANVHDSSLADALIQGNEEGYFADKAYSSQAFRERLEGRGLVDGVAWRGRPHHALEAWQRLFNVWSSSIRCGVERAHATMKQWYGMSRVRYRGLARNACHLRFVVTAMNMKRAGAHGAKLRDRFPAIRQRRSARRSNKPRRPQDARTLVSNHPCSPQKGPKPLKTSIVRSSRYDHLTLGAFLGDRNRSFKPPLVVTPERDFWASEACAVKNAKRKGS
jgi:transposase, IS5 family